MSEQPQTGPDTPQGTPPGGPPGAARGGPPGGSPRGRRRLSAAQWPTVLGLTVVWVLLWGTFSVADVVTGILVGLVVCVVFPLPPIETQVRLRPVGLLRFTVRFVIDMTVSTWRLNRYILGPRPPLCAVLAVRMRTPSDLMLTATSVAVAAVPGSNVLDVHRASGTLFVHVVGAGGEAEWERARYEVLRLEDRVVRAFGTRADIAALDAWERHGPANGSGGSPGFDGPGPGAGPGGTDDTGGRSGPWKRS
ncbi:Na+/H+ antiporter subunit E [Streptomyces sp. WMMB 322]|uniref:Na+/H+ antiporter subunit E n=1 Tax=Streptomyces sp. WMMB 322 TaxID=1286821 RepID=UPI000823C381|nr:Na+/H+ antiporter subunit E [Streptomyces sp. WMMB 322]SCK56969.1 multicomponent Na+:H+ antiporter subunit E [Streptomyces sp. WMMB 322]